MNKQEFISSIKAPLKTLGYRKNANYWYKECKDCIFCVNVQGSQWDVDDYYVEIGLAYPDPCRKYPTILQWYCRHRCKGEGGEVNILPSEFISCLADLQNSILSAEQIPAFLYKRNAIKVVNQFMF